MKYNPTRLLAVWLALSAVAFANNYIVLPGVAEGTVQGTVYSRAPFQAIATFTGSTDGLAVLTRAAVNPADTKYYIISRSGSNSIVILNSTFQQVGQPINMGQNVTAAAITPDGRKLIVYAGSLRIYDTATDTLIQTGNPDLGVSPNEVVITPDSSTAFFLSPVAQRLTALSLTNYNVIGNLPLPAIQNAFVSMGPNGLLYVSAENKVLEVDPRVNPFDSTAIRRQFLIPAGGNVGKLAFTPDGSRAVAVNRAPQSGTLLYFLWLDYTSGGLVGLNTANYPELQGATLEKLTVSGNNRALATTSQFSTPAKKLYFINLPDPPPPGIELQAPTIQEAVFSGEGTIPIVESFAVSRQYPEASTLFIAAPFKSVQPLAQNTLFRVGLNSAGSPVEGKIEIPYLPGFSGFAAPYPTTAQETVSGYVQYNARQPQVLVGTKTLPLGIRILGVAGNPLFNVPVTFASTSQGVVIEGNPTVLTNADGLAYITVNAPPTPGDFTVTATIGGSGLSVSYTLTAVTSGSGGDPGGGSGGGGAGSLRIVSGNGLVVKEGEILSNRPMVVEVLDAAGKPVSNVAVTWTISQGGGGLQEGTGVDFNQRTTTTGTDGRTQNVFQAPRLALDGSQSFGQSVITATANNGSVTFYVTTVLAISSGGQAPLPSVTIRKPEGDIRTLRGKAGQVLNDAIQVQITSSTGQNFGAVIPNVGLTVSTGLAPADGPTATCDPDPIALTDINGVATCNLKLGGKAGRTRLIVDVGAFSEPPGFWVEVEPGEPNALRIVSGNNQSANANQTLPGSLIVEVGDGGGNTLAGANIRWEVISGSATINGSRSTLTTSGPDGRSLVTVRLGELPGQVQIKATALGGSQPSVTFTASVNVTVTGLAKVGGDGQTTFTNTSFPQPLTVEVRDQQNQPVPGVTVNFVVASGSGTLSAATGTTNAQGRASVNLRAGPTPGAITVNATVLNLPAVTFTLNSQLPGPVISNTDFYIMPSGERGVVPGAIVTIVGQGIAPNVRGLVVANNILGPLPTRLADVEVQFGSTLAPIFQVGNDNGREFVTVQAPFELAPGGAVAVTVRVGAGSTVINNVQVGDYQPGLFEYIDQQKRRYAVILRPDGSFVSPENPARRGELLRAFLTGLGQVTPPAVTNRTGIPGQNVAVNMIVGLNDAGVRLVSAYYSVGRIGVYEIVFEVPTDAVTGPFINFGVGVIKPNGQVVFANGSTTSIAP